MGGVGDQREIKSWWMYKKHCLQATEHPQHMQLYTKIQLRQNRHTAATAYRDLWTNAHICTFLFHFALKPQSEHSFTVLMRQRIKQQTDGPLCSPFPPQQALFRGVEKEHGWGRVYGRRTDERKLLFSVKKKKSECKRFYMTKGFQWRKIVCVLEIYRVQFRLGQGRQWLISNNNILHTCV